MAWTEERVKKLTILWKSGNSASKIAIELGEGVSRNAVIGKIHRLGLSERGSKSNLSRAKKILTSANVSEEKKVLDWNDEETANIRSEVSKLTIEGELRAENQINIKRLMDIGSYRGIRHRNGLPLRGQRTKNNSRTRKGKRKTVANKKKVTK